MTFVELTEEDARLFIEYRRNQDNFLILHNAGIFNLTSGKIEININNNIIQSIYVRERTYEYLTEKR